ncbi:MAG: hypothetical protein IPK68_19530 [Bdellovibrionales bacterium]|nr:hypothetical protein [Bdellovibrionales bacterium]
MPGKNKASKIESLILRLLQEQQQQDVSIRSIARAAGVPENDATKRKAIRRA